ncbi:hypothetical protein [Candidatus Rhodobacter oscarellae]|uniref:hypothetical protein n=1 Tax=Candidatus Rhodobacter oscarellae TaxID=1675527 RepID=UPI0006708E5B|nr:hypothetical protein [Candidatus Rhodobacter lobularis]
MTKSEAFDVIKTKGVNAVTTIPSTFFEVTSAMQLDEIDLEVADGIAISAPGLLIKLFYSGGLVTEHFQISGELLSGAITVGERVDDLTNILRSELKTRNDLVVTAQRRGFGAGLSNFWINPQEIEADLEGNNWLHKSNAWFFGSRTGYREYNLFFESEILKEVDYRNFFIDRP